MSDPRILELTLTVACGAYPRIGRLDFVYWLRAQRMFGNDESTGTLLHRPRAGREFVSKDFAIATGDVDEIARTLSRLGLPGRRPKVDGVDDTSDVWNHAEFLIALDSGRTNFDLAWQASGIDGPDSDMMKTLIRRLVSTTRVPVDVLPDVLRDLM